MTTSSDTTFDLSRDEVISQALANVGAIGFGKTATGVLRDGAAPILNRVVKALDADGKFLWRGVRREITTTDGTASYTLAADVLEVEDPMNWRRASASSTARTPVRFMSQDDYMQIVDRTIEGIPTHFSIEYALPTTLNVLLYPVPDTTNDKVEYRAMVRALDYDTGAETGDFPARWLNCLVYGLTAELALPFGQPALMGQMRKAFLDERDRQMGAGDEKGPLILVPWGGF